VNLLASELSCQSHNKDGLSQTEGLISLIPYLWLKKVLIFISKTDLHLQHKIPLEHRRTKRNVFFDMIEDLTEDDDDDDDGSEETEYETTSESVESTTTRFGRFMSPLAFSKISETLGMLEIHLGLSKWSRKLCYSILAKHSCNCSIHLKIIEINLISLRNSISHLKLIQLCSLPVLLSLSR
jgi:hypothetical protein